MQYLFDTFKYFILFFVFYKTTSSKQVNNKEIIFSCGGFELLQELSDSRHERIAAQAKRALVNLGKGNKK